MMTIDQKIVRDPIHGDIKIKGFYTELLETPEIQRLYNIKQLGFAHLVFPGAHHTRLEHCLGAHHIAQKITDALSLDDEDTTIICCAALLHDIGHGPFSHTLESILLENFGVDHVDLTEKLLLGEYDIFLQNEKQFIQTPTVHQILEKHKVDIQSVIHCIRGIKETRSYRSQILHSAIDVDQLDYLIRDAYYTGVAYGMIDIERLLQTLVIVDQAVAVLKKGVHVLENILMARGLMYSSVYFHKTVRIAELMLSKAFEMIDNPDPFLFFRMTDAEIMTMFQRYGGFQHEIVTRLKYRQLYKQAYTASVYDLAKDDIEKVKKLEDPIARRAKEKEIGSIFGIPPGHIIIDLPLTELLRAEPRINKTDMCILDKDHLRNLDEFTPISAALRTRITPDWHIMIITDEEFREKVAKKSVDILFS